MRTRGEIEAAIADLGWTITGPTRRAGGWKATIQRDNASMLATAPTELAVLEDLLRAARDRARRQP